MAETEERGWGSPGVTGHQSFDEHTDGRALDTVTQRRVLTEEEQCAWQTNIAVQHHYMSSSFTEFSSCYGCSRHLFYSPPEPIDNVLS